MTRPCLVLLAMAVACTPPVASEGRPQPGVSPPVTLRAASGEVSRFTTIQDAIDAASSGDTVHVPAGTYTEDLDIAASITVAGAGQDTTLLIGTVDITGASETTFSGFGITSPTYVVSGTWYTTPVGVNIDGDGGTVHVRDVAVRYFQYGVYSIGSVASVIGEVTAAYNQYGIYTEYDTGHTLQNDLVHSNAIAGIRSTYSTGLIAHNTLWGNGFGAGSASLAGAIALGNGEASQVANNLITANAVGLDCVGCTSTMGTNLVWGNTSNYADDASAAATDLALDPLLVGLSEGDVHLSPASPCIDAGADVGVAQDHDGDTRPAGEAPDIGCDELLGSDTSVLITEVMANAATEATGEFVEIYNAGDTTVDLAGYLLTDGDAVDTLQAWSSGATELAPGAWAVVLDADYDGVYSIPSDTVLLTTGDSNLGNGLTTADPVSLYEADGTTLVASFSHPADPGDGVSMELVVLDTGDVSGNWRASACGTGASPGAVHCFPESGDPAGLVITEVMANASDERTGEFVELYNPTSEEIDLAGLVLSDGDSSDVLQGYLGGSALLGPGVHALIVDPDFAEDYVMPAGLVLATTPDSTLGNGVANASDSITLYQADGATPIDSYTWTMDPGDGVSVEKVDYTLGDVAGNWVSGASGCGGGHSAGRLNGAAGGLCEAVIVSEIMANAVDEDTGEYVELYNAGAATVDLAGLVLSDGDATDVLQSYGGGSTTLAPGGYALVLDAEYAGDYALDSAAVLLTTGDTTLGNALSVSDPIYLYEADGVHLLDAFRFPANPGNGISLERQYLEVLDDATNWAPSTCAGGGSPGAALCTTADSGGDYAGIILITEVMSNPATESTGEFVELYNAGPDPVDLAGFILYDGDAADPLEGFADPLDTVLDAGDYAVILDADYPGTYAIPSGTLLLTTDDAAIGTGLAVDDPVSLYEPDGVSLVDSYTWPLDAGDGRSVDRMDPTAGDMESNWAASDCASGSSPGLANDDCTGSVSTTDADGDGYDSIADGGTDCDDTSATVHPGAVEICDNGLDDDCDGTASGCGVAGSYSVTDADVTVTGARGMRSYYDMEVADLDGDGALDLISGAYYATAADGDITAGLAYVTYGPVAADTDTFTSQDLTLQGEHASNYAGRVLAAGGDLDGDGADDLVVTSYRNGTFLSGSGAVYFYLGGTHLTGDRMAEATSDTIWYAANSNDYLGSDAAFLGDLNGDGLDDLAVGAYGYDSAAGSAAGVVYLLWGDATRSSGDSPVDTAADVTIEGHQAGLQLGYFRQLSSPLDADGDGLDDLWMSSAYSDSGVTRGGEAYLFYGDPIWSSALLITDADASFTGAGWADCLGQAIASPGDTDGDGYEDLLVGSGNVDGSAGTDAGAAWLFPGGAVRWSGTADASTLATAAIWGVSADDRLGAGVAGGDVDGDGHADLVLGAYGVDLGSTADTGEVYVFSGPVVGVLDSGAADATIAGDVAAGYFGDCVRVADISGDGQLDVLISAWGADELAVFLGGGM
ncbi:MAG: lamin tail domain-containing protein [Pseudomonadota bacterium]